MDLKEKSENLIATYHGQILPSPYRVKKHCRTPSVQEGTQKYAVIFRLIFSSIFKFQQDWKAIFKKEGSHLNLSLNFTKNKH